MNDDVGELVARWHRIVAERDLTGLRDAGAPQIAAYASFA